MLKRKIETFLEEWRNATDHKPLIVRGARQTGKTTSIRQFAAGYQCFIEINFVSSPQFKRIFDNGFMVDEVLKQMTMIDAGLTFVPYHTLIFFDEMQEVPDCATCLKFFCQDGRFDVICSGSLMGINYKDVTSNSVGYKTDYEMHSLDFEEFLWALGYKGSQIDDLYAKMLAVEPLTELEMNVMRGRFTDYMLTGGMPAIVSAFVANKNFSGILDTQRQLLADYEEDITKYAQGIDKAKIKNIYRHIPVFLGKDNKKFQITKVAANARGREYVGTVEWLSDAGIVNVCYNMDSPELPLKGNYNPKDYKIYFRDNGLLIASLDDETQYDLRANQNFNTYKGAIYENIVADMLVKSGYELHYYRNEKSTVEMDFMVRDSSSLIPVEVKAGDNATASLKRLITDSKFADIKYGIKLCNKNIGYNGQFFTFPYFLTFLLRRFLREQQVVK